MKKKVAHFIALASLVALIGCASTSNIGESNGETFGASPIEFAD